MEERSLRRQVSPASVILSRRYWAVSMQCLGGGGQAKRGEKTDDKLKLEAVFAWNGAGFSPKQMIRVQILLTPHPS